MAKKNIEFSKRLEELIGGPPGNSPVKKKFAEDSGIKYSSLMTYLSKSDPGRVASWENLVKISKQTGKSIDWLLTGEDNKINSTEDASSQGTPDISHIDIIREFEDKAWAREQNKILVLIEKKRPKRKKAVTEALDAVLAGDSAHVDIEAEKEAIEKTPEIKKTRKPA